MGAGSLNHPRHCFGCPGAFPNDIAIMYLERPTTLNEFVQPMILASAENDVDYESALCYSSGWGKLGRVLHCINQIRSACPARDGTFSHIVYVVSLVDCLHVDAAT